MMSPGTSSPPDPGAARAPEPAPRLGIVIVTWNVVRLLARCLATVRAARLGETADVVVIDNASTDDTFDVVRAAFPDVHLIANPDNRGFTRGNNQGLRALGVLPPADHPEDPQDRGSSVGRTWPNRGGTDSSLDVGASSGDADPHAITPDYVLLLNPDTEVAADALAALVRDLSDHPTAACVGPRLVYPDGTLQSSRRRFPTLMTAVFESTPVEWHWPDNPVARAYRMADVPPDVAGEVDWVTGAAMLFRTEALRAAGGFDEGFFMYSEELDLCRRLRRAGWEVRYTPRAVVVHHEGSSSDQVVAARHLHFSRSRVRYFRKHHGRAAATVVRIALFKCYSLELCIEAAKWLAGHQRPLRKARMAAYWALLRDGLAPGDGS